MLRVLVTGGAGFIGSHLVELLLANEHEVYIIDNLVTGSVEHINQNAHFYKSDINSNKLEKVFKETRPEIVFHLAAQSNVSVSLSNPIFDETNNIQGTINILEMCRIYGVKKIVYSSSAAVYGKPHYNPINEEHITSPVSFYGASKLAPEYYIKIYSSLWGLEYTILRYANVYGPRQNFVGEGGVISIFINRILEGKPLIIYGTGYQTRDFVYVKDIINANLHAIDQGDNSTFNIGTGTAIHLNKLVSILSEITGKELNVTYEVERPGDISHSCLDNTNALSQLLWKPHYSLKAGLLETYKYYKDQRETNLQFK